MRRGLAKTVVGAALLPVLVGCVSDQSADSGDGAAASGTVVRQRLDSAEVARPASGIDIVAAVESDDGAWVRGYSASGEMLHGKQLPIAPIGDTALLRYKDGYAVADKNSILTLNPDLTKDQRIPVDELTDDARLAAADSSPRNAHAIFALTLPPEEGGTVERTRIVSIQDANPAQATPATGRDSDTTAPNDASRGGADSRIITRKGTITAMTACDDGSAAWLEFNPSSVYQPDGPGTASLVTWTDKDGVESYPIDYTFPGKPWSFNQLDCDLEHHRLVAPDGQGGVINVGIRPNLDNAANYALVGKRKIVGTGGADAARLSVVDDFGAINGDTLAQVSSEGAVSTVDMYDGAVAKQVRFGKGFMSERTIDAVMADADYSYVMLSRTAAGGGDGADAGSGTGVAKTASGAAGSGDGADAGSGTGAAKTASGAAGGAAVGSAKTGSENLNDMADVVVMGFDDPACRRSYQLRVGGNEKLRSVYLQQGPAELACVAKH